MLFLFFLGNTPKSRHSRAVVNPNASARKPISRHSHVYPVIPAQAGIQCVEFQLFRINFETLIASFPQKWESSFLSFSYFR